jgi:uncharacterized protein YybS (DUF2232 family)
MALTHSTHSRHSGHSARRTPTRGLTEGAILAALAAIIASAGLVIPPVAIVMAPLPIMILAIRWGMRVAVLACVIAALALLQFTGPLNAVSAVAMFAPLGLALGWGVRRGLAAQGTILSGAVAFLLATLAMLGVATGVLHQDVLGEFITSQIKAFQMAIGVQQRLGAPAADVKQMQQTIQMLPQFMHSAMPAALALGALLWSYMCYTLARKVFGRLGHPLPAVPPILRWRLSTTLATAMLWGGAVASLAALGAPNLVSIGVGAMIINLFVFGFQGVLVGVRWAGRRGYPPFVQVLFGFMLLSTGMLPVVGFAILGMLDTWFDFRRLTPRDGTTPTEADAAPEAKTDQNTDAKRGAENGGRPGAARPAAARSGARSRKTRSGAASEVVHQR